MLSKLNKDNIPNLSNVDEAFESDYDPDNDYSVPYREQSESSIIRLW